MISLFGFMRNNPFFIGRCKLNESGKVESLPFNLTENLYLAHKRILGAFQKVTFFGNWHTDWLFLSLAVRKIHQILHIYINVIRVKNDNCECLQNLCTDFLVALSVEIPWMFTL